MPNPPDYNRICAELDQALEHYQASDTFRASTDYAEVILKWRAEGASLRMIAELLEAKGVKVSHVWVKTFLERKASKS